LEADVTGSKNPNTSTKRKMSEMILEFGAGLVDVGETVDERQNRLNAACTAWNMACVSSVVRQKQLEHYKEGYLRRNSATSPTDLANIIKDMELLIERKLKMFPNDKRQIISARAIKAGTNFRIEIACATFQ